MGGRSDLLWVPLTSSRYSILVCLENGVLHTDSPWNLTNDNEREIVAQVMLLLRRAACCSSPGIVQRFPGLIS